jgi:hypothetical protein
VAHLRYHHRRRLCRRRQPFNTRPLSSAS